MATEARIIEADGVKRERAIQDRVSAKRAGALDSASKAAAQRAIAKRRRRFPSERADLS